jgi:hypothetical protein
VDLVEPLVHAFKCPGIEALQADVHVQHAAALRQIQKRRVRAQAGALILRAYTIWVLLLGLFHLVVAKWVHRNRVK